MCGIFGFDKQTEVTKKMVPFLAWEMENRGTDSWGATNGTDIYKHLGPISGSLKFFPTWERAIYHTRMASQGSVNIDNAHPHIGKLEKPEGEDPNIIIGVHNGCISNHDELNRKYERKFECDSMHIFQHLAEGKDLHDLFGWAAIVWIENGNDMFIAKCGVADITCAKLESGEIAFCSTDKPLYRAARFAGTGVETEFVLEKEKKYRFENGDLIEVGKFPWADFRGSRPTQTYISSGYHPHASNIQRWNGHGYDSAGASNEVGSEDCFSCNTGKIDPINQLVCTKCFQEIMAS